MDKSTPLKIGLNLLYMQPGKSGGIRTYAFALIRQLARLDRENTYFIFLSKECPDIFADLPPNFKRVVCGFQARNRPVRYAWEQLVLPWKVWFLGLDVMHSLAYVGPVLAPCASVVTTHDLNFLGWGKSMKWSRRLPLGCVSFLLAHRSRVVITVSEFSRRELVTRLWLAEKKVVVVPNATEISTDCDSASLVAGQRPYLVAFANGDENKNIVRLLAAFSSLPATHELVLLGNIPPYVLAMLARLPAEVQARVRCPGYVSDQTVQATLRRADLLIFPSLYEGFGLPILEANASGIPVACSRAASLPEVAGDAAEFFDPESVEDMASVIARVLNDADLRRRLVDNGWRNLRRYSWEDSAKLLLSIYRQVAR